MFLYEQDADLRLTTPISSPFVCHKENCNAITDTLKKSDRVDKRAHLIVVVEVPKFTEQLSYKFTGNLIFQQEDRDLTLVFPAAEISAYDATVNALVST